MKIKTKKKTVQQLLGLETFGKYGLIAGKAEYVVFSILPSNIAVMSLEEQSKRYGGNAHRHTSK